MSKLFVSYRRKSWPFTHRLAEELGKRLDAEIFVDYASIDEDDFERSILRNLRESDAVLLVISDHTFADRVHRDNDWVRREIREALVNDIPMVLVAVDGLLPPPGLPEDIKDVARKQAINFYPDYFIAAVDNLADFVVKIGVASFQSTDEPVYPSTMKSEPQPDDGKTISGQDTLREVLILLDDHNYDKAIFLLEALKEQGFESRFVNVDQMLSDAREYQTQAERLRRARLELLEIEVLAESRFTESQARAGWEQWCQEYPDLIDEMDTLSLAGRFAPAPSKPIRRIFDLLPAPFDLIDIPAGNVTLINTWDNDDEVYLKKGLLHAVDVPAFAIAKYPVTNAQFALFKEAKGYQNRDWWTPDGWRVKEEKGWAEPRYWQDVKWNGAEQPVVGVSWYEAVAFCLWLSEATGDKVMLPNEQQWQWAAQGDVGRKYPWGPEWDCQRCNNNVSPCDSSGTTPVTQYEGEDKSDSPFGVVDMAGNVWEWCRTAYNSGENDVNGTDVRVLRGGSWYNNDVDYFRVDGRDWYVPNGGSNYGGFRFSLSSSEAARR